jgi:hypothetical protein
MAKVASAKETAPARGTEAVLGDVSWFGVAHRRSSLHKSDRFWTRGLESLCLRILTATWNLLPEIKANRFDLPRRFLRGLQPRFRSDIFYFQAADMITQVLNFGLPAQVGPGVALL